MTDLDLLYARFLQVGFIVIRQAIESAKQDWIDAELELLHNVPSLVGEGNPERHRYFWFQERAHHMEWVSAPGREEAKSRMLTYYQPIWDEMEPLVARLLTKHEQPKKVAVPWFTVLDPASGKVLVKLERAFAELTEGIFEGSEHFTNPPYRRIFQKGKLAQFWWLNFEAGGKKFDRDSIPNTIKRIEIILPSGTKYDLWTAFTKSETRLPATSTLDSRST